MYYGCFCSFSCLDYSYPCSSISLHFRCIMAAPAASVAWVTAALAAPSRCISDVLWLLLQLQLARIQLLLQVHLASFLMYYGCSSSFSCLDYSCLAASSRFISDVSWLLLQLQLPGLQLPCSFISFHFQCIMAAPAASALWVTAALEAPSRIISNVLWLLQ